MANYNDEDENELAATVTPMSDHVARFMSQLKDGWHVGMKGPNGAHSHYGKGFNSALFAYLGSLSTEPERARDNASLIEEYRNLVKTGAEYAASELRLAPTSAFEIYMGHFRDIGRDIEAALASPPSDTEEKAPENPKGNSTNR